MRFPTQRGEGGFGEESTRRSARKPPLYSSGAALKRPLEKNKETQGDAMATLQKRKERRKGSRGWGDRFDSKEPVEK